MKPRAMGHYWAQLPCWVVLGGVLARYGQALTHQMGVPVPISPNSHVALVFAGPEKACYSLWLPGRNNDLHEEQLVKDQNLCLCLGR